jgi:hypothetical protein
MDMMDKKKKMKALDLMIVLKNEGEGKKDGEKMDHSDCKCPCCGKECAYCNESENESSEEEYKDEE